MYWISVFYQMFDTYLTNRSDITNISDITDIKSDNINISDITKLINGIYFSL